MSSSYGVPELLGESSCVLPLSFTLVSSLKQQETLGFEFQCLCLFYCDVNLKKTKSGFLALVVKDLQL